MVTHRYDESGRVFLAGCSPAEPASASSTLLRLTKTVHFPVTNRWGQNPRRRQTENDFFTFSSLPAEAKV